MRRHIIQQCLIALVLVFQLTAVASAGSWDGSISITDRREEGNALSFTVQLSGLAPKGQLAVTVFSKNGIYKECAFYPAKNSIKVQVNATSTDTVKIAWLDDSHQFLASPDVLRMSGETSKTFSADLQKMISSFNPASGAESVSEDNPYFLQRLLVKCDELPDLTNHTPEKILTGPDGLFILSFSTAGETKQCAEYLTGKPSVRYVEPDQMLKAENETAAQTQAVLMDSDTHRSWGVEATKIGAYAENLRQRNLNRQVVVAVLDSGVDANHPFLSGRLLPASNCSTEMDTEDHLKHGTHVTGIIADCTQGSNVKILPVKVMDSFGSFTTTSLVAGIYEAVSKEANVINLSLSAPANNAFKPIEDAVRYAISKNITVVAAAGNQNIDTVKRTPAHMEECITVSAVDKNETRFDLSNYGAAVDLAAPGVLVDSSVPGGLYKEISGTSMATPHVSAAAALLICEQGSTITPAQIGKTLCSAARYMKNQSGWKKEFGYGMLDMSSFLQKTQVTISYQANGGTGSMSSHTADEGSMVTLHTNTFRRDGYTFTGWNTKADGTGTGYGNQVSVKAVPGLTLYAQWQKTAVAYAVLYSDGELVFQTKDTPTVGRTVVEIYPINTAGAGNAEYAAWYDQRKNIKTVTFAETIQPVSTALWFYDCGSLTTINGLDKMDTSKVTDMSQMFADCSALTELDLTVFSTGSVTNMTGLFLGCTNLKTIYVSDKFTTVTVTSSRDMFKDCAALSGGKGTGFNSSCTDKSYARIDGGASAPGYFTDPNAPQDGIYAVVYADNGDVTLTFQNNNRVEYAPDGFVYGPYAVNESYQDFHDIPWYSLCDVITTVTFVDKIQPASTALWFSGCTHLRSIQNIENLDTSNVTDMSNMFSYCSSLGNLDLAHFDTSNVVNMEAMFMDCWSLVNLDLSQWNTSKVTNMRRLFAYSRELESLDLSNWDTSHVTDMGEMFYDGGKIKTIYASDSFVTDNVKHGFSVFSLCRSLIGGCGTEYNFDDITYARIDRGPSSPGYFTDKSAYLTGIAVNTMPSKRNYYKQDSLDVNGLTIRCSYNNGVILDVSQGFTCSPSILDSSGTQIITVQYEGFTTEYQVSVDDRIAIYTADDLSNVHRDQDYILMNNIDLSSLGNWNPLCTGSTVYPDDGFNGVFDGNGKTISNMTVSVTCSGAHACGGLFGKLSYGTVKNLNIENGNVYAESSLNGYVYSRAYGGAVCGEAYDSVIINCSNKNTSVTTVASDDSYAGGIVGEAEESCVIDSCTNSGRIHSQGVHGITRVITAGGIVGWARTSSTFSNCSNTGNLSFDDTEMLSGLHGYKGNIVGVLYNSNIYSGNPLD